MKFLIFHILFSLFFSQYIITSWNYDKVAMYDIQKINNFLLKELVDLCDDLPDTLPTVDNIQITGLKLINVETNLYDSYLNYNNGLLLLTPNKITLYFNFSYLETTRAYDETATLELKINTLKINLKNNRETGTSEIISKMSSFEDNYNIPGIKDKDFLKLLKNALFSGFQERYILSELIPKKIDAGLLDYFKRFYSSKKEFKVETNDFFGNFRFSMRNNKFVYFCEDLLGEYKTIYCYYEGFNNKYKKMEDQSKVPLINEKFSHNNDDLFNIFINKDSIYDMTQYITKSYFYFNPKLYNNQTNIKQLSYDFTISSLKKYFNGLENFKDDDDFYCVIYIDYFIFNEANYRVKFIFNEHNFMLNVTSKIDINLYLIKNIRFNLALKGVKTNTVEVISYSTDTKIEISNLEGLKNAIDESYDFDYNKILLTDNGISMRDFFTKINEATLSDEGIYLSGNQLYQ